MTRLRVLHVLTAAHAQGASISRVVRTLAKAISTRGYNVTVWFLGGDGPMADELRAAGIGVRAFDWSGARHDVAGALRFRRSLQREKFSIVHLHFGGRTVPFFVRSARRTKIVFHVHYDGAEAGKAGPIHVRRWMADEVVALSRAVATNVVGVPPRVVYYGIEPREEITRPRGVSQPTTLGVASRLVPIKGIVYLIRALALLRRDVEGVRLEIAGAGPDQTTLRQEVHTLGLEDSVAFVGWQPDIWPWLGRWDILVQPSLAEGFGMAALEGMAAGLPVVASSVGGLPELVEDGRTGYVVPPADPATLAARLRDLVLHADLRETMGAAGRARVRQHFSPERMAAEIATVYDRLLGIRERQAVLNQARIGTS
ncbi:MAG: glycosyltransferase family 4 protein [Vicinamibacterales bacterium]